MATERFTKKQFEEALTEAVGTDYHWSEIGLRPDYRYLIAVNGRVFVQVSSTVFADGIAAATAEDSIRVWITDENGNPLGNKTQKYVTRVAGWSGRLAKVLERTLAMAAAIKYCETCHSVERVFVVKKEGKNKGRLFTKCDCPNSFTWLDFEDDDKAEYPVADDKPVADGNSPACPKCGGMMTLRTRRSDGSKFWGCRLYPACNGTRNYSEGVTPIVAEPKAAFTWSHYQIDIFQKVQNLGESEHLVVEALAGTGKTTTIAQSTKLLPRDKKIVVVAFNKHNVKPIQEKVPDYVKVCTYHSLGFAACRKQWGNDIKVDQNKVSGIVKNLLGENTFKILFPVVRQMVSLVKANLAGTSDEELADIAEYYGLEMNGESSLIFQTVRETIAQCAANTKLIDYDDMCWLPVVHEAAMEKYDYVYVDEAQDTNRNQIALALASVSDTGHIIAVGDRHQSMYGFRGADANAIPNLVESLEAAVLPLSITYRNPQCVVDLVRQKFPDIPLEGTGKAGSITYISYEEALNKYQAGDMVLCRTNAPLVAPVFELIRRGIKAVIRGRDIGSGLLALIAKMKAATIPELMVKLEEYKEKEFTRLMRADKTSQAQSLVDKVETLVALSDGVDSIFDLEHRVKSVFSDEVEGVVFSTIHRAKGLEAEDVYILGYDLLPHPMAKKEWELIQEANIEYVALTRTLCNLVYVPRKKDRA